jgi:cellulose synthase/poly-beta-1,6-N-acetylglucosamine synthase-like glycosyltransferase
VRHMGGAGLYRRSVLKKVGTFNPYLYSDEEPELCVRIRHAGYRVVGLNFPIAYHYTPPSETFSTLIARRRRRLYLGSGQSLRYHLGHKTLKMYLWERGYGLLPGLALVAGLLSLWWWYVAQESLLFICWTCIFILAVSVDALRKRSLYLTVASLHKRLFILDGTIRGFFLQPHLPDAYTARLEVIQWREIPPLPNSRSNPFLIQ